MSQANTVQDVVLAIADISGYTSFLRANVETMVHSQVVITILLETILEGIESPLAVSKLEGDAVFFYTSKPLPGSSPGDAARALARRLLSIREAFDEKVVELSLSRYCDCEACRGIRDLRLKLVVHSGKADFHRVGRNQELAGVDVILVHRLLKNSVPSKEYVLVTADAEGDLEFPPELRSEPTCEDCEGVGEVHARAYFLPSPPWGERETMYRTRKLAARIGHRTRWTWRIYAGEVLVRSGIARRPAFRNVPARVSIPLLDRAFALLSLLLLPLLLPVLIVQNVLELAGADRAAKKSRHGGIT